MSYHTGCLFLSNFITLKNMFWRFIRICVYACHSITFMTVKYILLLCRKILTHSGFDGFGHFLVYICNKQLFYGYSCTCAKFSLGIVSVRISFSHE